MTEKAMSNPFLDKILEFMPIGFLAGLGYAAHIFWMRKETEDIHWQQLLAAAIVAFFMSTLFYLALTSINIPPLVAGWVSGVMGSSGEVGWVALMRRARMLAGEKSDN